MAYTQDELKDTLKKLLSSDIKHEPGQSDEEFISKLKARALPLVKDLYGAELNEFNGEITDKMKSALTNELLSKLSNETGIAISFSEDLPNYKQIKDSLLEVISELQAIKI